MKTCPAPSNPSIFDIEKLTNQFDDRAFALEIASHFVSNIPEYRAELEACFAQQNIKQTLSLAHRLKEAAASVTADRISTVAFEMESAAKHLEQTQTKVSDLLSEFLSEFVNAVRDERSVR